MTLIKETKEMTQQILKKTGKHKKGNTKMKAI